MKEGILYKVKWPWGNSFKIGYGIYFKNVNTIYVVLEEGGISMEKSENVEIISEILKIKINEPKTRKRTKTRQSKSMV